VNNFEAAANIASQLGISTSQVEIISIRVVKQEKIGNTIITWYEIKYRITQEGVEGVIQAAEEKIASSWNPTAKYISKFGSVFRNKANSNKVIDRLQSNHYLSKISAKHEADIAHVLGKRVVNSFQYPYKPYGHATYYVDIDTRRDIAFEAKSRITNNPISPNIISKDVNQAITRLLPTASGELYRGVGLIYPNNSLSAVRNEINLYEKANPGLKIGELSESLRIYKVLTKL